MRYAGILLALALFGCAHDRVQLEPEDGEDFFQYHHVAIPSFADSRGQGAAIADSLSKALQTKLVNDPVNRAVVEQILLQYKVGPNNDLGTEVLEAIRVKTSADAIIFGKMAPDWSAARIIVIEATMGAPVLRAVVMPEGDKKAFKTPDEISQRILHAFSKLH